MLADAIKRFETVCDTKHVTSIESFEKKHPDLARRLEAALNTFSAQLEALNEEIARRET